MSYSVDDVLFYSLFFTGGFGFVLNIMFLIVLRDKDVRQKGYMIFIGNRALIDLTFSLHVIILQPFGVVYWLAHPAWCTVAAGVSVVLIVGFLLCEPILALNRYVAICHKDYYSRIYQKKYIYLMCTSVWIVSTVLTLPHIVEGSLGRVPGYFCCIKLKRIYMYLPLSIDYPAVVLAYGLTAYCYCRILLVLRRNQKTLINNSQLSRLKEDRSILRYIGTIGVMPLVLEMPFAGVAAARMYDPILVPDYILLISSTIFYLTPLINPILTVCMVRPVRKEFLNQWEKIMKKISNDQIEVITIN